MRTNLFLCIVALLIGCLGCYGFYLCGGDFILALSASLAPALALIAAMGVSIPDARTNVSFKLVAYIAFVLLLSLNIFLFIIGSGPHPYIIWDGIMVLVAATAMYLIARS